MVSSTPPDCQNGISSLARKARNGDVTAKFEIIRRAIEDRDEEAWNAFIEMHYGLIFRWAQRFIQSYNMRHSPVFIEDICQTAIMNFYVRLTAKDRGFDLISVAKTMEYLKATVWSAVTALRRSRVLVRQISKLNLNEMDNLRRIIKHEHSNNRLNEHERNALLTMLGDDVPISDDPDQRMKTRLVALESLVGVLSYHSQQDTEAKHLLAKLTTQKEFTSTDVLDMKASAEDDPEDQVWKEESRRRLWYRCLSIILGGGRMLPNAELSPHELRPIVNDPRLTDIQREDLRILYRHYLDGYPLREIFERWSGEYRNIRTVYRIKERLLRRLCRNATDFEDFAGTF